ncbi:DUF6993 domain-containing protein [Paenarthrobacter ureafaciens]|uniref:DUF6993 domain-containing protein n=1 Tax=Paenarthrobacter ureafaciens TaxID=37931 RepID=UPI002DB75DCD|nr:hypothetical protein [Paenarthrobacter ureafaciens]MEC3853546.1 hypothetical protein [Paenarthrobacter ureafaciens]
MTRSGTTPGRNTLGPLKTHRRRSVMVLACVAAAMALASCTPPAQTTQTASEPTGSEPAAITGTASPGPTLAPEVSAATKTVEATLKKIVATTSTPEREAVRSALVAAGIPASNVEVSVSRTPTGLDVDAMEAAALAGGSCVVGQIRDGGVVMTVLPVLASGKCFVGDVR